MKNLKFKTEVMAIISFVISVVLILGICWYILTLNLRVLIFSIIIYALGNFINSLIWRCPYCNNKLPYGVYTYKVHKCKKCGKDLKK